MNKLPWFTHDTDARRDLFIRRAVDRFGHFGYAAYFMLLEVIQSQGDGDSLEISARHLAEELFTRPVKVVAFLEFAEKAGKVQFSHKAGELHITVPRFAKRNENRRYRDQGKAAGIAGAAAVLGSSEGLRPIWNAFAKKHGLLKAPDQITGDEVSAADLEAVLAEAETLPFLHGKNDRGWKVTLPWLLKSAENRRKVLERATYEAHEKKPDKDAYREPESYTVARAEAKAKRDKAAKQGVETF